MGFKYNPITGELDVANDFSTDTLHVKKSGDTMTGELDIQYDYPLFKVRNTAFAQYSGAGFYLINNAASMGNQAGATFYMGINDAAATQGFFAMDKTNTSGGGTGHLLLFDYNANKNYLYAVTSMPGINISAPTVPATAGSTGTAGDIAWDSSFIYVCVATNTWKRTAISTW